MNYTISNEQYTAVIASLGAELISLKHNNSGTEIMWQCNVEGAWSKHSPLLFPFCGRLKDKKYTYSGVSYDMGAHGFISKKEFTLLSHESDVIELEFSADESTLALYPFAFNFKARYELKDNGINCKITVTNGDNKIMPFMFGWHPGFALPTENGEDIGDYELYFNDGTKAVSWIPLQNVCFARPYGEDYEFTNGAYPFNEEQIYKNDTMIFKGCPSYATLRAPSYPYSLSLKWSENTPYLCIWKEPDNRAKFICIEPWSNSLNDGDKDEVLEEKDMIRLNPGDSEEFTYFFGLS